MASIPREFWEVKAVTADSAWAPRQVMVLMSAWIPAPPEESEPAMVKMYFMAKGQSFCTLA
jgi:hypothetical protein